MKSADDIAGFLAQRFQFVAALQAVERLNLADCWIAAGAIRNAIWDALHGRSCETGLSDTDVVYFDIQTATPEADKALSAALAETMPGFNWSVKNQARMHLKNNDPPYANTSDAMRHWPEICTAIAARSCSGVIEILAPYGVQDLLELRVRPTPAFAAKPEIYRRRLESKKWGERWPSLSFE